MFVQVGVFCVPFINVLFGDEIFVNPFFITERKKCVNEKACGKTYDKYNDSRKNNLDNGKII